jgi:riboflavin kinase/FMN adenylyltransferase
VIEQKIGELAPGPQGTVAAIGNFDGVHAGHQALIARAVEDARQQGRLAAVISFWPHPMAIVDPARAPGILTTRGQRRDLLARLHADLLCWIPFTAQVARMTPGEFVGAFLGAPLGASAVWVGDDFRFGRGRSGGVADLERLGAPLGFAVRTLGAVAVDGERVSSSGIRDALAAGEVGKAGRLLGRPYALTGTVVTGDGRGRLLGFPTANLAVEQGILPAAGVYAARSIVRGGVRDAVVNVGFRPTFGEGELGVEVHLPGFSGDLLGERLEVDLVARLRQEQRFPSPDALRDQIAADVAEAVAMLRGER